MLFTDTLLLIETALGNFGLAIFSLLTVALVNGLAYLVVRWGWNQISNSTIIGTKWSNFDDDEIPGWRDGKKQKLTRGGWVNL